jgi:hypothetical protein
MASAIEVFKKANAKTLAAYKKSHDECEEFIGILWKLHKSVCNVNDSLTPKIDASVNTKSAFGHVEYFLRVNSLYVPPAELVPLYDALNAILEIHAKACLDADKEFESVVTWDVLSAYYREKNKNHVFVEDDDDY